MNGYADLAKILIGLALAVAIGLFGRSCGVDAGEAAGEKAREELADQVTDLTNQLNGCATSLNFANHVVEQEQEEAGRQKALAEQAAARALLAEQETEARVAALKRQLADARKNPDAAAQLDIVLHPSIPLR